MADRRMFLAGLAAGAIGGLLLAGFHLSQQRH
jgi:hypothetical protein